MTEAEAVRWAILGVETIIGIVSRLGHRDAVLEALHATLVAGRAKNDADLAAKHRT